jgi:hypothetical protein
MCYAKSIATPSPCTEPSFEFFFAGLSLPYLSLTLLFFPSPLRFFRLSFLFCDSRLFFSFFFRYSFFFFALLDSCVYDCTAFLDRR